MIRRYTTDDIPKMVQLIGQFLEQSPNYNDVVFSHDKVIEMLQSNVNRKAFFCSLAFHNDELIGGLCADTYEYSFSREAFAADLLFFITESKRSLKLATELVAEYIQWGKDRHLREIRLASTTGIQPERFGNLCKHLGFKPLGSIYSMEV